MHFSYAEKVTLLAMQKAGLETHYIAAVFYQVRWRNVTVNALPSLLVLKREIEILLRTHALLSKGWLLDFSQRFLYLENGDGARICVRTDTTPEGELMNEIHSVLENRDNK